MLHYNEIVLRSCRSLSSGIALVLWSPLLCYKLYEQQWITLPSVGNRLLLNWYVSQSLKKITWKLYQLSLLAVRTQRNEIFITKTQYNRGCEAHCATPEGPRGREASKTIQSPWRLVYPRKTTGGPGYVRVHIYVFTCINLHTRTNARGHIDTRHTWAFTYFHEALQVLL